MYKIKNDRVTPIRYVITSINANGNNSSFRIIYLCIYVCHRSRYVLLITYISQENMSLILDLKSLMIMFAFTRVYEPERWNIPVRGVFINLH